MGPTCTGKTALALQLAAQIPQYPLEIINVDSALVYKHLDIGTGKPTLAERSKTPHHLIDILEPTQSYSVAHFCEDAHRIILAIIERGNIPLLVGGTMLYFKALQQGLSPLPAANPSIRRALEAQAQQQGWESLHQELATIDPLSAQRIHPNDPQRIQRALEVYKITGRPMSSFFSKQNSNTDSNLISNAVLPYSFINFGLMPFERKTLHQKIAERFHNMLQQGFIEEVKALYERGDLSPQLPAMRTVGYRQIWDYLEGRYKYDEMIERAIAATRQLAKRQITWLRSFRDVYWLGGDSTTKTIA